MVAWFGTKAAGIPGHIARHEAGDKLLPPLVAHLRLWCGLALAGEPWPFRRSRRRWSRRLRWHRLRRRAVAVERSQDGRARRFGGRRGRKGGLHCTVAGRGAPVHGWRRGCVSLLRGFLGSGRRLRCTGGLLQRRRSPWHNMRPGRCRRSAGYPMILSFAARLHLDPSRTGRGRN